MAKRICTSKKTAGWLSCLLLLSISPCYSDTAENKQETVEGKPNVEQLLQSLTLENALKLAEISGSPEIDIAEAEILESTAELATVKSKYGVRIKAEAVPRYVYAIDTTKGDDINDSYYFLSTSKVLSDFGRTATLSEAAEADIRAEAIDFVSFRFQRRLKIIKAYLDVLLSDKRYAVDNENMVIKFLKYDKSRERQELGEVADVDLLELESAYRSELINRMRSSNRQSESRAELAMLLNRPDQLPGELQPLRADVSDVDLLEYDVLLQKVLTLNPQLAAQHERVKAAQARLEHSRMSSRPVLDSAVELGNYERRYGEGGKWRVGVNLTIPFREGGRFKAEIAKRQAELKGEQARYQLMKNTLRKQVLELVQELEVLKLAQESAKVRLEYHDQHMDRSRARYELELQTDLGNAAAGMTEAQWDADRVKYNFLLTLGNIDALLIYATLSQAIELPGVVQYERIVELGVPVSGVVSRVMADEGQSVKKNDRLLELEETPFVARLEKLDADLRLLKAEHGAVAKELARDRELYERMVLSTVSLDGTQLKMVRVDSLVQAKQAEQKLAKYELAKSRLEAPFAGKIIERLVEPGQSIRADMQSPVLFRLADTSSFIVEAEVTGDKIAVLKHGASLDVRIQGRTYNAVVKSSNLLAPARSLAQPARYLVKLKLDAADDGFFPGQPAALILSGIAEQ